MRGAPACPRCRSSLASPDVWSSDWRCAEHGAVSPLWPPRRPSRGGLEAVRQEARVPIWVPWPPPAGWLVTGFADAGDERAGARAIAVALSGPAPSGGPADLILVAEEPGIGLGSSFAGLPGPDPGAGFGVSVPGAAVEIDGRNVTLWAVESKAAAFAGEALGNWLWAVLWPDSAGLLLMVDRLVLRDLRECDLDLPYGALCPRLGATPAG